MDTKWKNRKKGISFIIFFAGVTLTLGSGIGLLQNLPGDFSLKHPDRVLQDDYQQSRRFRNYISDRLETFLAMATDSYGSDYYHYYDYYDDGILESTAVQELIPWEGMPAQEQVEWEDWFYNQNMYYWQDGKNSLTDEERAQRCRKYAQQYHDSIKKDENLLYSIAYDGKVLYANSDLFPADGQLTAPEGYNFLLYYADGKVRILKDGKELDIYGNGYYRDDSEWYVPGYRNFIVDEDMKKAVIYMAAAKEPVLYSESLYGKGSYGQLDNSLYWMRYNILSQRKMLILRAIFLAVGLVLLAVAFLCRKSKREADAAIAGFTGKIWFEGKVLFVGVILLLLCYVCENQFFRNYGYTIMDEVRLTTEGTTIVHGGNSGYDYFLTGDYIRQLFLHSSAWGCVFLFWLAYLVVNDLRRNRKVWEHGLIAKLYRTFTSGALQQPLPVKTARRSRAAFVAALVYGLLMLAGGVCGYAQGYHHRETVWGMGSLFFLILVGFLVLQYRIGMKNMETAKDLEILSDRIKDIRNGDYDSPKAPDGETSPLAGHDLEDTIAQLEDIRHGMVTAVDEQMKSERMKVELIANVSHDIKTPLTSIISYVQFLKEEKELPEHVQDYVKILDEKSQRLKNMVQDVFAVSKAASGELPMHMEELDFGKLLRQTLADMEEQIENSKVTFRTEIPEEPVLIVADGQRMYRVFQNLFQNAIQYSLDGSRVFVTLQTDGCLAVASVKNTSSQELEKDKDFTERFTRGDQSRTDGGSGLGLSIAQSFTEACGGSFSWETNADLFVVTVSFRLKTQSNTM